MCVSVTVHARMRVRVRVCVHVYACVSKNITTACLEVATAVSRNKAGRLQATDEPAHAPDSANGPS